MADFPALPSFPQDPSPSSYTGVLLDHAMAVGSSAGAAVWPTANRAIAIAFFVETPITLVAASIQVTTQSGNLDFGIYDYFGNRIVSKGSTAVAAAGQQTIDLTASVTGTASPNLTLGTYFMVLCVDNGTAAFQRYTAGAVLLNQFGGVQQVANGSVTLGATLTWANPASAYVPLISLLPV